VSTSRLGRRIKLNHYQIAPPDLTEGVRGLSHAAVKEGANGHLLSLRSSPRFSDFALDFFPAEQLAGDARLYNRLLRESSAAPRIPRKVSAAPSYTAIGRYRMVTEWTPAGAMMPRMAAFTE
jgi:hypothetical protein